MENKTGQIPTLVFFMSSTVSKKLVYTVSTTLHLLTRSSFRIAECRSSRSPRCRHGPKYWPRALRSCAAMLELGCLSLDSRIHVLHVLWLPLLTEFQWQWRRIEASRSNPRNQHRTLDQMMCLSVYEALGCLCSSPDGSLCHPDVTFHSFHGLTYNIFIICECTPPRLTA